MTCTSISFIDSLKEEENILPWFYRIIQNTIIDLYRKKETANKTEETLKSMPLDIGDEIENNDLCQCFEPLVRGLKPEYRNVLEIDLKGLSRNEITKALHITPENLKVRRSRGRAKLKEQLKETCNLCAVHGCLNCTCET